MRQVGTRGNPNADIMIVGEAWGGEDTRQGEPFRGPPGKELEKMLREAGINPEQCFFTNVVNKQPQRNDFTQFLFSTKEAKVGGIPETKGLYLDVPVHQGLALLDEAIEKVQPKIIVALGNIPLWALTEDEVKINSVKGYKLPTGITNFRGSMLRSVHGIPLLPTYHPAACLRNYSWRYQAVNDLSSRVPLALEDNWDDEERDFIISPNFDLVMETLNAIILRAELAPSPLMVTCDIETLGQHIECVGFAWTKTNAICIPIMSHDNWDGYWSAKEEVAIYELIKRVVEHPNIFITGQNFFYDYQYFWYYYNIKPNYRQDTMLAHHVCYPGTLMGLSYLSSLYCRYHRYWKEDGKEAAKTHDDQQRWIYNCRDCVVTYEVMETLWKVIEHYGLEKQYAIQMVRARSAIKLMIRGTAIDAQRRGKEQILHMEAAGELEAHIDAMLPESVWPRDPKKTFWFRSNQQLAELFYDTLGLDEIRSRKSGNPTTDNEALKKIGNREPALRPLTEAIQQYRSLEVFGHFVNMKVGPDGRMRANFSPTTETFRYRSSSDVFGSGRNLQNLPTGSED